MTLVHAITPHHRGAEMLAACLESLDRSTGVDLQVVVVANGRDAEIPGLADRLERVSVVRSEVPLGFSAANNLGVEWARRELGRADYHFFVNNDVVVEPTTLHRLVRALEETGAKIAGPQLLIEWARDHLNSLGLNVTEDAWGWDEGIGLSLAEYGPLPERREVLAVTGSALLIDAELFAALGGWTELYEYYFEDIDLCLKARRCGGAVIHEPEAVAYHHISASVGLGSERKDFLFRRNRLLLAMIHWPESLLLDLLDRAVFDEILAVGLEKTVFSQQGLREALLRAPEALEIRRRLPGSDTSWTRFLRPAGSVPRITLPEPQEAVKGEEADEEAEAAGLSEMAETRGEEGAGVGDTPPSQKLRRAYLDGDVWNRAGSGGAVRDGKGKTILIFGCSPLPFERERMNYAPGGRTWQFAASLAAEGHRVVVACARIPGAYDRTPPPVEGMERDGVTIYTLEDGLFFETDALEGLMAKVDPDVLVGATARPSRRAVELAGERPLWVDVFGDVMAEGQAHEAVAAEWIDGLPAYRDLLVPLLRRGDAFSAVSERQRYSLIGQLGLAGRLNRQTADHELVWVLPCCASLPEDDAATTECDDSLWKGDFVLLWGGGFNTWCDVDTLVAGVTRAMDEIADLRCVVTGGAIAGHDETTFERFRELVRASGHADRFALKGSVDLLEARRYAARANVGVVTELPLYERELGSSGRVVGWLACGLPVICTGLSEIGRRVADEGAGFLYEPGDAEGLARAVVEARRDPRGLREKSRRALQMAREALSPEVTTVPLCRWVRDAAPAPDRRRPNSIDIWSEAELLEEEKSALEGKIQATERKLGAEIAGLHRRIEGLLQERQGVERRYHEVRSELGKIHQSRMWKMWMAYLAVTRFLGAPWQRLRRGSG